MRDTRLTPDAARVVLHYAMQPGPGPHPYDADELKELLEEAGPKRIAAAVRRAERLHYLTRKIGGRGHPDAFFATLRPAETDDLNDAAKHENGANRPAETDGLKPDRSAETEDLSLRPAETDDLNVYVVQNGVSKTPRAREHGETDVDVRSRKREDARAQAHELSGRFQEVFDQHADLLRGCRDSYRDYVRQRVPTEKQAGHIQSIVSWLQDNPTSPLAGVPANNRTGILAAAFNELLQHGERTADPPMKWPDGDIRNLRTKIGILKHQTKESTHGQQPGTGGHTRGNYGSRPTAPVGGKAEPGQRRKGRYDHITERSDPGG